MRGTPIPNVLVVVKPPDGSLAHRRAPRDSQALALAPSSTAQVRHGAAWGSAPDPDQWIEEWERRQAAAALTDLQQSGVDQDLEELRAGWSSSRSTRSAGLGPSRLNRRGDVAAGRMQTVGHLRKVAEGDAVERIDETSVPGMLSLGDAPQASRQSRQPQPHPKARTAAPRPSVHRTASPLKAMVEEDDPWAAWERRWEETFQELGAHRGAQQASRQPAYAKQPQSQRAQASRCSASSAGASRNAGSRTDHERPGPDGYGSTRPPQAGTNRPSPPPPRPTSAASSTSSSGPGSASRDRSQSQSRVPPPRQAPPPRQQPPPNQKPPPRQQPPPRQKPPPEPAAPLPPRKVAAAAAARRGLQFASFAVYEDAWSKFEANNGGEIGLVDIPWPLGLPSITGIGVSDESSDRKRKLRAALLRWHPDKWTPMLDRVIDSDKAEVTERIKEVTRRVLDEKQRFG